MQREEKLEADRLCTGDKPSIYAAGMLMAHAFKKSKVVAFTQNVLGQVVMLHPSVVHLDQLVLLPDEDLDQFEEDVALALMVKEGRNENDILSYVERRKSRQQQAAEPERVL
jgi:hypothetical protein